MLVHQTQIIFVNIWIKL